jgi:hypothetical protein
MLEAILMIGNLAKGLKTSATTGLTPSAHNFNSRQRFTSSPLNSLLAASASCSSKVLEGAEPLSPTGQEVLLISWKETVSPIHGIRVPLAATVLFYFSILAGITA